MVLLNKEQAKSLLLAKRDAYLSGKLSCRPSVVKSLIQRFVKMLSNAQVHETPKPSVTYCEEEPNTMASLAACPILSVQDYQFDQ